MAIRSKELAGMRPQRKSGPIPNAYLRLIERFLLVPIRTARDLARATALADELFDRPQLLAEEEQFLDVLCDLIEAYEDDDCSIPDVPPADMLRFLIDRRGVTQQTIARETAIANSTLTALLKGDRELTRIQLETFARYFGVEPAVFLPNARGACRDKRSKSPVVPNR